MKHLFGKAELRNFQTNLYLAVESNVQVGYTRLLFLEADDCTSMTIPIFDLKTKTEVVFTVVLLVAIDGNEKT